MIQYLYENRLFPNDKKLEIKKVDILNFNSFYIIMGIGAFVI